mgnify:CR=1 FL=1
MGAVLLPYLLSCSHVQESAVAALDRGPNWHVTTDRQNTRRKKKTENVRQHSFSAIQNAADTRSPSRKASRRNLVQHHNKFPPKHKTHSQAAGQHYSLLQALPPPPTTPPTTPTAAIILWLSPSKVTKQRSNEATKQRSNEATKQRRTTTNGQQRRRSLATLVAFTLSGQMSPMEWTTSTIQTIHSYHFSG